jgi:hypothetical protein
MRKSRLAASVGASLVTTVSFEARNPELEGRDCFGEEIRSPLHADRAACPEEG